MDKTFWNGLISSVVMLSLVGCANDQQRTVTGGTVIGGCVGAVCGGALGALEAVASGDREHIGEHMMVRGTQFAMVGLAVGYQWGKATALKKADYANTEDYLDDSIAQARDLRAKAEKENGHLKGEVEKLSVQSRQLTAQLKQGQATQQDLKTASSKVTKRHEVVKQEIERVSDEISIQKKAITESRASSGSPEKVSALNSEVAALQQQKAQLQEYNQQLQKISNRYAS